MPRKSNKDEAITINSICGSNSRNVTKKIRLKYIASPPTKGTG